MSWNATRPCWYYFINSLWYDNRDLTDQFCSVLPAIAESSTRFSELQNLRLLWLSSFWGFWDAQILLFVFSSQWGYSFSIQIPATLLCMDWGQSLGLKLQKTSCLSLLPSVESLQGWPALVTLQCFPEVFTFCQEFIVVVCRRVSLWGATAITRSIFCTVGHPLWGWD